MRCNRPYMQKVVYGRNHSTSVVLYLKAEIDGLERFWLHWTNNIGCWYGAPFVKI